MAESESNPNPTATDDEEEKGDGGDVLFLNPSRHEHELSMSKSLPAYRCSGCKEYGANIGYKCKDSHSSSCKNFTLHEACANLPDEFQYGSRKLYKFCPKTHLRHHCDACRDVLEGFVFEAERPDHYLERLHPLCMVLPEKLKYGGHEHRQLELVPGDDEYCCSECRKKITAGGWRYRCEEVTCQVNLDLSCAKINFYELSESGIARVAPMSRSRRFRSGIASALFEGTISGVTEAILSERQIKSSLMAESESNRNPTATDDEEEKGDGGHVLFLNPSRHEHELSMSKSLPAYRCSGCKEYGANIGYKCKDSHSSSCKNFTLHEACANLPDEFQYGSRKLYKFCPKTHLRHHCDACRDVLEGFVFEAERPDHYLERLHPLCMVLPEKLKYGGHEHRQQELVPGDDEYCCSECRKKITAGGWRYRCEEVTCQVNLDLSCAKIIFYELSESGIARVAPMSRSRFRSGIASALFEGAISGVTEAILSSIIS